MMKATELRLNNMILDRWGAVATVDTIGFESTVRISTATYKAESCSINDCEPIPLTEEWLLKFGFKKTSTAYYMEILNDWTSLYFCDGYFEISVSSHACPIKIDCVHQLQNLFYCLTGEELEVKNG